MQRLKVCHFTQFSEKRFKISVFRHLGRRKMCHGTATVTPSPFGWSPNSIPVFKHGVQNARFIGINCQKMVQNFVLQSYLLSIRFLDQVSPRASFKGAGGFEKSAPSFSSQVPLWLWVPPPTEKVLRAGGVHLRKIATISLNSLKIVKKEYIWIYFLNINQFMLSKLKVVHKIQNHSHILSVLEKNKFELPPW